MQKSCDSQNIEHHPTLQKFVHAVLTQDVELVKSCLAKNGSFEV
jgi:hypothetical protein